MPKSSRRVHPASTAGGCQPGLGQPDAPGLLAHVHEDAHVHLGLAGGLGDAPSRACSRGNVATPFASDVAVPTAVAFTPSSTAVPGGVLVTITVCAVAAAAMVTMSAAASVSGRQVPVMRSSPSSHSAGTHHVTSSVRHRAVVASLVGFRRRSERRSRRRRQLPDPVPPHQHEGEPDGDQPDDRPTHRPTTPQPAQKQSA